MHANNIMSIQIVIYSHQHVQDHQVSLSLASSSQCYHSEVQLSRISGHKALTNFSSILRKK